MLLRQNYWFARDFDVVGKRIWHARMRHRVWGRAMVTATAVTAVLGLGMPMAVAQGVTGYHFTGTVWNPKPVQQLPGVSGHSLTTAPAPATAHQAVPSYQPQAPVWPAAGTSTVTLGTASAPSSGGKSAATRSSKATAAPAPVRAGSLPVWLAQPAATGGGAKAAATAMSTPGQVRVQLASHQQALAAGANGMLLGLARADGKSGSGPVQVVIDYASLAKAYGGGYGSRLQVVQVPACALTTPQSAACQKRTPVAFTNRAAADQLTATVTVGASTPSTSAPATTSAAKSNAVSAAVAQASAGAALEVTSGAAGSQGNYAATSLNPSGTWQASDTGAFTYSYPIDVPSAVGGNAPSVALSYDSQAVDGETSARNSQASWVGDGWDYAPGFVERTYRSCGSLLDSSNNHVLKGSGDECWGGDNATISFGSHSGVLIPIPATISDPDLVQQWKLQGDDGTVVQELKGADNGLYQGIYYRVLGTDGSAAYFGADHAPTGPGDGDLMQSGTPSDTSTSSAWGVPVLHPVSGDPCYDSTDGTKSKCSAPEGWRWNLDFVVSPTGFVQRYDYATQTNYYDLGGGQVAASNGSGTLTQYTSGGQLTSISYGYQLADELAGRTPAGQVDFASAQRCQKSSSFDCTATISTSNATNFPDVPYDLSCPSTDSTTLPSGSTTVPANVCITSSPTFWSTTRLDSITTKVNVAGKGLTPVDSYQLTQTYSDAGGTVDPVTGTSVDPKDAGQLQAVMWLQSITHTGYDNAGNQIAMNPVTFQGTEIDNRVNDASPAAPPLYHPRISTIQTETGESIAVDYNLNPCAGLTLSIANADTNTNSCYPVYWAPTGESQPIADWFNKTTVHQVTVSDLTVAGTYNPNSQKIAAGSEPQVTTYSYTGPAWHRDDSAQTDDQYRTWDQFRGFRTMTVQTGTAPEPITQTTVTYLQGMDGDYLADGTKRSVSVSATLGGDSSKVLETVTDNNWLAGTPLETDTYTSAGGTIATEQVAGPFTYTQTASVAQTPWTDWNSTDEPGTTQPTLSTLPNLLAERISASTTTGYALLADGTTWRQTKSTTTYDSQGRPSTVDTRAVDAAFGASPAPQQENCTTTTYAAPPSGNALMLSFPDRVTKVTGAADVNGVCPAATSGNLLSDQETYYDGDGSLTNLPTFGQLGSSGNVDANSTATGWSGSTEQWRTTAALSYDGAGRVTQSLTPDPTGAKPAGLPSTTAYTPAWSSAGGNTNPTTVVTINPQGWTTTSQLDPLRGLETEGVDANGRKTDTTYDALGRRTAVWLPGRAEATQTASETFAYSINPGAVSAPTGSITTPGAPSAVTTKVLREDGTYATSIDIYDGMLQLRQTQSSPLGDTDTGRLITDSFYDSHGWPSVSYGTYSEPTEPPSTTLFAANENQIPSETSTTYDGQGRATASTLWHDGIQQWQTATSYPGVDETTSTPPAGGATTQTFTNALDQTVKSVVENTNTGSASALTLDGGQVIPSGTSLMSDSVRLTMQAGGNLVLSSLVSGNALWSTSTSSAGSYAVFGTDGNLTVYSSTGTQQWSTGLAAATGSTLALQNDGNLVDDSSAGSPLWSSGTGGGDSGNAPVANATTSYTYDTAGRQSTVTDSAGNQWSYHYDLLGELTSQTDPNTGTSSYGPYDVDGNLLQLTDSRGQKIGYTYDWDDRETAEYDLTKASTESGSNELASWAYDSLAKGLPTSSTRYVGGTAGSAYTEAVTGYNAQGQPTGGTYTIPATDGFAAAGKTAAPASGTVTYTLASTYTPNTGLLATTTYQADGGLPAEQVTYGYNQQGDLNGFGGYISSSNTPDYVDNTGHDAFGQVLQTNYGPSSKELATYAQYDPTTGAVTQTSSMLQSSSTSLDVTNYRYNQVGEITAIDDLQNNTTHDTQCFSYDSLQQLTQAWTDTAGINSPTQADPSVGDVGGCNTATPQTSTTSPVTTSTIGGPAPYWQTYTYDLLGDRTGMVQHDTTGNAANDTTQSIAFAGSNATAPAAEPNEGGTVTTSNPTLGTTTQSVTHTDTGYTPNENAGNTMSRSTTSSGRLTTGFTPTGGGPLCIDDSSSATTPGNKVQVYTCNGSSAQSWTIGTNHSVQVLGMCLDTTGEATASGTAVVINTCDSTKATQQWKAGQDGTLVNGGNSSMCLADPAGAAKGTQLQILACGGADQTWNTPASATSTSTGTTPAGQSQNYTYDAEGRTSSVSTTSGANTLTTSYLYDAGGNLLEETSSKNGTAQTRILYLFGGAEQITLNVPNKSWTALRTYVGPDGTTITRTSAGSVSYQVANTQGTAETSIDASSLAVTRRYYDPYGNPRGPQPTTFVSPDDNQGFLGKPTDTTSGLDLLGARTYDPTQGRFTSPDPVFEAGDPNQMGGYAYAGDDPASSMDPTGLFSLGGFLSGVMDGVAGDTAAMVWNSCAYVGNGFADFGASMLNFNPYTGFQDADVHPIPTINHPFAHLFGYNTDSGSYQAGNWTGIIGSVGFGAYGAVSDAVKAVQAEDDTVTALKVAKKLVTGTHTGGDPADGSDGSGSGKSGKSGKDDGTTTKSTKPTKPAKGTVTKEVPSTRGTGGSGKPPVLDIDRATPGWSQAERLKQAEDRVPAFALWSRTARTASRSYVGALNIKTGDIALASSGGAEGCAAYCAEGNALIALGGNPEDVIFTHAYQVVSDGGALSARISPVCENCQFDYSEPNFVPGITAAISGIWHDSYLTQSH